MLKRTLASLFLAGLTAQHAPVSYSTFQAARAAAEADLAASKTTIEANYQSVVNSDEYEGAGCPSVSECDANIRTKLVAQGADDLHTMPHYFGPNATTMSYKVAGFRYSTAQGGEPLGTAREKKVVCTLNGVQQAWYNQKVEHGFWASYYGDQSTGTWRPLPSGTCY